MTHTAIDTLSWLIEQAYEGDPAQSLLANLRDLHDDDWTTLPPGCGRSVSDILEHVGWCKWMYEDYAFGPRTLRGDLPPLVPSNKAKNRPLKELLAWLAEGHSRWLQSVKALPDDSELDRERYSNWGELLPTRHLIRIMIGHDFYHAGEINHIRALLQGTDRWPY
jgi:uncharacterized damage-inducible protein DinB